MIRVVHPGSRIRILTFSHPGSRIQGSKRHPIPDPGSATLENNQKIFTFKRTNLLKTKINHRTFCLCTTRIPKTLDSTGSLDSDPRWQIDIKRFKKEYSVADGEKIPKLFVCKSPGTNIENPGDPFMTYFASLT